MSETIKEGLRVGVVGAGIGAGYVAGFQTQRGVEVTAICARTPTKGAAVALKYKIPRRYTVYEEMLAQESLHCRHRDAELSAPPHGSGSPGSWKARFVR